MSRIKAAAYSRILYGKPVPREKYIQMCMNACAEAGKNGADIFVLPEHFDSFGCEETFLERAGIPEENELRKAKVRAVSEPVPGPMTEKFGNICKQYHMYAALTFYEREQDLIYNTCVLLDRRGEIAGKYRKTHLCGTEGRCSGVTAGNCLPVFETDFGILGITICMDLYYPEIYRILTLKGAKVILWPHQTYGPSEESVMLQAKARALDNGCYLIGSDFASPEPFAPYQKGHAYLGRSGVIDPNGLILSDTGHKPGTAYAEFDPAEPRMTKDVVCIRKSGVDRYGEDIIRTRRPELYDELTKQRIFSGYGDFYDGF